jgi:hypothetical protein
MQNLPRLTCTFDIENRNLEELLKTRWVGSSGRQQERMHTQFYKLLMMGGKTARNM